MAFGIARLRLHGFRSARDLALRPHALCALVGEAGAGKSNVLAAVWTLLDPGAPRPALADAAPSDAIDLAAELHGGARLELRAQPPGAVRRTGPAVEVAFLPAWLRAGTLAAPSETAIARRLRAEAARSGAGRSAPAASLVAAVERLCADEVRETVLLVEEPELYLRPQAQRYLYRLLRAFAERGNQVLYSTHAPAFLSVARLDELVVVEHDPERGTTALQPQPLEGDELFRAFSEFDAERSELFLARAALLVEGRTEKLAFPFVFRAAGIDPDREGISIVECGGKPVLPVVARVCDAVGVPYVVVHDRDAPAGREPIPSEQAVNREILEVAGAARVVELVPDFEGVAGLHGRAHKPEHAWREFVGLAPGRVPALLREAVARVAAAATA